MLNLLPGIVQFDFLSALFIRLPREGQSEWHCIQDKVKVSGTVSKRDRECGGGGGVRVVRVEYRK